MRDGGCSRLRKDLVLALTKVGGEPSIDGNLRQGLGQCSESKPGGPGPKDDGPSVQRTEKGEVIPDQGGGSAYRQDVEVVPFKGGQLTRPRRWCQGKEGTFTEGNKSQRTHSRSRREQTQPGSPTPFKQDLEREETLTWGGKSIQG